MLALFSQDSVIKDNPRGEWQIGSVIGKQRKVDFVIPLRVNPFPPERVSFLHTRLQYIDFENNWAEGLRGLFKTLDEIDTPKNNSGGASFSIRSFLEPEILRPESETVDSNYFRFSKIPDQIKLFEAKGNVLEFEKLRKCWAFRPIGGGRFLSLTLPPQGEWSGALRRASNFYSISRSHEIMGINTRNLISELLRKQIYVIFTSKGHELHDSKMGEVIWKKDLDGLEWIRYYDPREGRERKMRPTGFKTFRSASGSEKAIYHRGGIVRIFQYDDQWYCTLQPFVKVRKIDGRDYPSKQMASRSKAVVKHWFNRQHSDLVFALAGYIQSVQGEINKGNAGHVVELEPFPLTFEVPITIDESLFSSGAEADLEPDEIELDESIIDFEEEEGEEDE